MDTAVEIEPDESADRLRLQPYRHTLPSRFRGYLDDLSVPYVVEVVLAFNGKRVSCEELVCRRRANGLEVSSGGMSKVRVAEIVQRIATQALEYPSAYLDPKAGLFRVSRAFDGRVVVPDMGRVGPTDEQLEAVGVVYTLAYACGGTPRRAVMEAFTLPRTTANRWIRQAREKELLTVGAPEDETED